jgi:hypothetical protein
MVEIILQSSRDIRAAFGDDAPGVLEETHETNCPLFGTIEVDPSHCYCCMTDMEILVNTLMEGYNNASHEIPLP